MSDISLRTYIEEIDSLIERKQLEEATAHCRHILSLYPKHLEAYRMLGKALLEKGRHGDAADVFQRVLSVVPDDFIAHLGMAIIREDEANLDSALWHMERAFEVNPANPAIQEELRRLYARRDGVTPPKARLTRGALARMYALGDLHQQAEAELQNALTEHPERVDLETVLAQVYYAAGQFNPAAKTCAAILEKLPYSRDANRILADILRAQGRAGEATPYRHRLEAIDPYEAFADPHANGHGAAYVKSETIRLPRLDYAPGMEDTGAPDWVASAGLKFDEPEQAPAPEPSGAWLASAATPFASDVPATAELPDWLRDMQPASARPAAPTPETAPETAPGDTDWLSALRGETPTAAPAAQPTDEVPDWLKSATGPLEAEAVPDWMRAPAASATPAIETPFSPEPAEESAPDWLTPKAEPNTEVPDWMKATLAAGATAAAIATPAPAPTEGSAPDWLTPKAETSADMPDWMKAAAPEAGAPDWLRAESAPAEPAALTPAEDLPEWMRAAAPAATSTEQPADELPDWMKAAAETPAAPIASEDKPDWLKQMEAEADAYEASVADVRPAPKPKISAAELPDFLQPASTEALERANRPSEFADIADEMPIAEEAPAAQPADLPDWLKAMAPPEPEAPAMSAEEALQWADSLGQPPAEAPALPVSEAIGIQPADELPDWAKAPAPGPSDTIGQWLASKPVPEWMRAPGTAAEPAAAPPAEWLRPAEPVAAAETPAEPNLDQMSPDEALRWLEGLAVQQGAKPEELITQPRDVSEAVTSPLAAPPTPSPAAPDLDSMSPDEALRWLEGLAAQQGAKPEELITQPPAPPVVSEVAQTVPLTPPPAEPDLGSMSAEEALRWLEGLAAQQGAPAEELITTPEERTAQPPQWIAAEPQPEVVEPVAEATLPSEGDIANMSADEAMRWLEGLAAQQGAPAEELITTPEERLTEPPQWLAAEAPPIETPVTAPIAETVLPSEGEIADMSADEAMRWLEGLAAQQGAPAEELITTPEQRLTEPPQWLAAEAPAAEAPAPVTALIAETVLPSEGEIADMSADEAMRWLEGLAAQQGAKPEELITAPEERTVEPPQWLAAEPPPATEAASLQTAPLQQTAPLAEPVSEAEAAPPPAEGDVFRWLEGLETPAAAPVAEPPPPPPPQPPPANVERREPEGTTKLSRLADQLAARKRAKEEDLAKRFETQRAEKEAAMREVQDKMEQKKQRPGTGPFVPGRPGTGPLGGRPGTGPLTARPGTGPLTTRPGTGPLPTLAEEPTPEVIAPKKKAAPPKPIVRPKKGKLAKSPYAAQTPSDVLDLAHRAIREGNDDVAVDAMSYLIAVGQGLNTIIGELETATRARPDAAGLWQVLGDAYMRDNHLQKALDAYRQALGQL